MDTPKKKKVIKKHTQKQTSNDKNNAFDIDEEDENPKKLKNQYIFVQEEDDIDDLDEDNDNVRLPYESPKKIYEIIQSKKVTLKILKQMKQSMLANDFWLPEFELNGGINSLLKLLRSSKVPFNFQPTILDILEDIAHIYPLMIMNAPGSIKFILHNFHCESIVVRTHIIKVLHELITYNSITHEKLLLGLSAYEQFIYGKSTPAFTSVLDLLTDGREERNEFAVENAIRFINGIIDTPASLLVRVQLRSHIKSLKIPYLLELISEDFDSEDIKKQIENFFDSAKQEEECFQDMNVNHIKDPVTLMMQMNKVLSTKSYHPIFLSIIHNLYITAFDKKDGKKQLNKIHKFLYKPEIPNLDSRSYLPPMGQHDDPVVAKKKKVVKKKIKKSLNKTKKKSNTLESDSDSKVEGSLESEETKRPETSRTKSSSGIMKKNSTAASSGDELHSDSNKDTNGIIDIQEIMEQNNKLKQENESLKQTLNEKEGFIRERESANLQTYKLFKEREVKCKSQVTEVLELFKKQVESYKLLTKFGISHTNSSGNLHSIEHELTDEK